MLSFINSSLAPEQVEIEVDSDGIKELINYLQFVERSKDHIHLTIDTELIQSAIPKDRQPLFINVKSVTIRYCNA